MIQVIKFKNSKTNMVVKVRIVVISRSWLVAMLDIAWEEIQDLFLGCGKCSIPCSE